MKQKIKTTLRVLLCSLLLALTFSITVSAASTTQATIGKKKYSTLQKAVNAVKKGQTIKLSKDIVLTKPVEVKKNVKFTVDLNKHVITFKTPDNQDIGDFEIRKGNVTIKNGTMKDGGIQVEKRAKLTINGGTYRYLVNYGTSTIINGKFKEKEYVALANFGGTLTIKKANVSTNGNCVYAVDGKVVINGGNFKPVDTNATYPVIYIEKAQVTINNGTFITSNINAINNQHGKLTINGGSFQNRSDMYATVYCGISSQTLIKKGGIYSPNSPAVEIWGSKSFTHTGGYITSESITAPAIIVWGSVETGTMPKVSIVGKFVSSPVARIREYGYM